MLKGMQNLWRFVDSISDDAEPHHRREVFGSIFALDREAFREREANGLLRLERSLGEWRRILERMERRGVERLVFEVIDTMERQFPVEWPLALELYPMDPDDQFGIERLGGVSGWTNWTGDSIHLVVWPSWSTWAHLQSTVVHEYHHHWRVRVMGNGHDRITLMEKIIREGLAEHFVEVALGPASRGPWVSALTAEEARDLWWEVYRSHANDVGDSADGYVFGGGETGLPLWAGYSLGYHLVSWYRETHPTASLQRLTATESAVFSLGL